MAKKSNEEGKDPKESKAGLERWQILVSLVVAIGTFIFGIWEFSEDSRRRAETAAFEARKPFLIKQLDLCLDATETAAKLASTVDPETWKKARERFWVLYWGPLSVVETPLESRSEVHQPGPVENQMVAIKTIFERIEFNPQLPERDLEQPAFELAHKCRDLILKSWKIK